MTLKDAIAHADQMTADHRRRTWEGCCTLAHSLDDLQRTAPSETPPPYYCGVCWTAFTHAGTPINPPDEDVSERETVSVRWHEGGDILVQVYRRITNARPGEWYHVDLFSVDERVERRLRSAFTSRDEAEADADAHVGALPHVCDTRCSDWRWQVDATRA